MSSRLLHFIHAISPSITLPPSLIPYAAQLTFDLVLAKSTKILWAMVEHNSTTMEKRSLSNDAVDADGNDAKRARVEGGIRRIIGSGNGGGEDGHVTTLVEAKQQSHSSSSALVSVPRTSELKAPTMCLLGHGDAVHSVKFSHCGNHLASGSFDKQILLWNVFGDCDNYAAITGHKNAVQEVQWAADNMYILSASADQTLGWWDVETGSRVRKLSEHENIVNSCSVALNAEHTLGSASDDKTAKLWDPRQKACTYSFDHDYQVLTVALTRDGQLAYTAGVDHKIRAWDVRKPLDPVLTLPGHADIVTGCALSPDDAFLVSTGMDTKTYLWDVRPFVGE